MLTPCQNEILTYTAAGMSAKEIADHTGRSIWTVQKTLCNVKEKTGLQKATELVAYYFCHKFGLDFAEFRRQILSAAMVALMFFAEFGLNTKFIRFRQKQTIAHVRTYRCKRREYNQWNSFYSI